LDGYLYIYNWRNSSLKKLLGQIKELFFIFYFLFFVCFVFVFVFFSWSRLEFFLPFYFHLLLLFFSFLARGGVMKSIAASGAANGLAPFPLVVIQNTSKSVIMY
jgi:hypothetical protein